MQIYKDKQFLVFDFEDGKTVKYDFATKQAIGKSGRKVNSLCSQLTGLTMDELCSCCTDKAYGNFLRFINKQCDRNVRNIGTVLSKVPEYARFEQFFSAGIEDVVNSSSFKYTINDIPKPLIKLCREHKISLTNNLLESYKKNPNAYLIAFTLDYISLTEKDIIDIITRTGNKRVQWGEHYFQYRWEPYSYFIGLISEYDYNPKALLLYIDHLKTFEAMEDMFFYCLNLKTMQE